MLIDSHVNLHARQFAADREAVIERARAAGVGLMVTISDKVSAYGDVRARVFQAHIAAARTSGLPLVVHAREADETMGDILESEFAAGDFRLVMHCYTSGEALLRRTAALGAWFSVSGIATFRGAEDVRERVRAMPADRIIVETDCPYLAPVPHRGRRNEPAYVGLVLAKLAELRGWSLGEAEARTEAAFFDLFDRIPRP